MIEYWVQFIVLVGLLMASAFFSGAETALFSLSHHSREELGKKGSLAAKLLNKPSDLLVSILLGNLVINVLFFCTSAALAVKMSADDPLKQALFGLVILVSVIIFGEVLPKAFGISHAVKISVIAAVPLKIWVTLTQPLVRIVLLFTDLFSRENSKLKSGLTTDELKMLLSYSSDGGEISDFAGEMIEEVVELSELRVNSVMTPRVDLVFCPINLPIIDIVELGVKNKLYFLPVYEESDENVVGLINIRRLCLSDGYDIDINDFITPVKFIPENKRCGELLDEMIEENLRTMVVVDEYGGIAGLVTITDLMREVLGNMDPVKDVSDNEKVIQVSENIYRVRGSLSVTHWNDFFENPLENEFLRAGAVTTIGGFFISLLGRMPTVGDKVVFHNLEFSIEEMNGHRISWVNLRIK